jgi:hypothetical protein
LVQNFEPGGSLKLHFGQDNFSPSFLPQAEQKLASSGKSAPQSGQQLAVTMGLPHL